MNDTLTTTERDVCELIVAGKDPTTAVRSVLGRNGLRIFGDIPEFMNRKDVREYFDVLLSQTTGPTIMSVRKRKEHLSQIVRNGDASISDQMRAIDLLNKMDNLYTIKVDATVSAGTGVMRVLMPPSTETWEASAQASQKRLMEESIEV